MTLVLQPPSHIMNQVAKAPRTNVTESTDKGYNDMRESCSNVTWSPGLKVELTPKNCTNTNWDPPIRRFDTATRRYGVPAIGDTARKVMIFRVCPETRLDVRYDTRRYGPCPFPSGKESGKKRAIFSKAKIRIPIYSR